MITCNTTLVISIQRESVYSEGSSFELYILECNRSFRISLMYMYDQKNFKPKVFTFSDLLASPEEKSLVNQNCVFIPYHRCLNLSVLHVFNLIFSFHSLNEYICNSPDRIFAMYGVLLHSCVTFNGWPWT